MCCYPIQNSPIYKIAVIYTNETIIRESVLIRKNNTITQVKRMFCYCIASYATRVSAYVGYVLPLLLDVTRYETNLS